MLFDTDLLGLKYELIDYLSDHDIMMFEHYSEVEIDMSNREMKILFTCEFLNEYHFPIRKWAVANGFTAPFFNASTSKLIMRRR